MLGATTTVTFSHCARLLSRSCVSMAVLITSMPVGCATSIDPKYSALSTFFGSSIGVGNDCAIKLGILRRNQWENANKLLFTDFHKMQAKYGNAHLPWRVQLSVGKSVGRAAQRDSVELMLLLMSNCNDRSIIIRLQISLK